MKLNCFILVAFLLLLGCSKSPDMNNTAPVIAFNDRAETDTILYSIESVCKRKDIDKIHSFLKPNALFIIDGEENPLSEIVDKRDKDRALGDGSYEDVLSSKVKFYPTIAIATIKTKWSGSGILSNDHIRLNTVILEKTGSKWLITYWHASRGK
ncbi:MAG: hypothetical protein A2Y39_07060 [Candidatus Delongbacteria bacterium GWF2_40_14]|nr:MAG: hypothetical protein A2Y39_07060 [Candidatus Delongbacteria bacterium GWF2_40_14]